MHCTWGCGGLSLMTRQRRDNTWNRGETERREQHRERPGDRSGSGCDQRAFSGCAGRDRPCPVAPASRLDGGKPRRAGTGSAAGRAGADALDRGHRTHWADVVAHRGVFRSRGSHGVAGVLGESSGSASVFVPSRQKQWYRCRDVGAAADGGPCRIASSGIERDRPGVVRPTGAYRRPFDARDRATQGAHSRVGPDADPHDRTSAR